MNRLKPIVFFIPFLLLLTTLIFSLVSTATYLTTVRGINDWILVNFGPLFSISTFIFLILCIWTYFSPVGKVRIGGSSAKPILTRWRWFSITLTTTIAIGILFWATAEPLYHLHEPPGGIMKANSPESAKFAMSTMFLHWTFTPYGIYTLAGLVFALMYYNLRQPFSLGSMLYPLIGKSLKPGISDWVDAICLYSLVAGMAASLGAGILTIAGGVDQYFTAEIGRNPWLLIVVTSTIVVAFIISSVSGLTKGIRILSNINVRAFIAICLFVLIFGPTYFMFSYGLEGLGSYFVNFVPRSLGIGVDSDWANSWTVFYWANWLAWTPVTAAFLGRLAVGYTVREFILFNLVFPSLFSCFWMMIFSATAIHMDYVNGNGELYGILQTAGEEGVIYGVLENLPFPILTSFAFLLISFVSYVTAADSNTAAMSGLCSTGISPESPEPPKWIKITWGVVVGAIALIMVSFAGIDGIKMTSNLGGFPALFLIILVGAGLIRLLLKPKILEEAGKSED